MIVFFFLFFDFDPQDGHSQGICTGGGCVIPTQFLEKRGGSQLEMYTDLYCNLHTVLPPPPHIVSRCGLWNRSGY